MSGDRTAALRQALIDVTNALAGFVNLDAPYRLPYEHPLSAYDRAKRLLAETEEGGCAALLNPMQPGWAPPGWEYGMGTRLIKVGGSSWRGPVVGFYRSSLTEVGYAIESEAEVGSVQIYPAKALEERTVTFRTNTRRAGES